MTAILNKLVSACQTIEANAGSGGGGGSSTEYGTSVATLTTSNFASTPCYIPFGAASDDRSEAKIFINVNDEAFDRYYIEVVVDNTSGQHYCLRVFKNTASASDSTELTFGLTNCSHSAVDRDMVALMVNGINTTTSSTFTVYNQHTYKGHLAGDGDSGIVQGVELARPQFVPVTPSA